MKKRIISTILAVVTLISQFNLNAYAQSIDVDAAKEEDMIYLPVDDELLSLGYHGMGLTMSDLDEKKELKKQLEVLRSQEEGVDYSDDEIVYMADTKEEALEIADCYDARLVFYQYGVAKAVVDFSEELAVAGEDADSDVPQNIEDIVTLSSEYNGLPVVYQNNYIKLNSVEGTVSGNYYDGDTYAGYQYFHDYINDYKAWDMGITGKGIVVAVIDTGVNLAHEDMQGIWTDYKYNVIANDENYEGDYKYTGPDDVVDDFGHGTHVAGLIAAVRGNHIGVTGVAPDAKIMPIKLFDGTGFTEVAYLAAAVHAAVDNGADILNMSLGSEYHASLEEKAINYALNNGCVVVAAAGNETLNFTEYPAGYDGVISVASLTMARDTFGWPVYKNEEICVEGCRVNTGKEGWVCPCGDPGCGGIIDREAWLCANPAHRGSLEKALAELEKWKYDYDNPGGCLVPSSFTNYDNNIDIAVPGSCILSTYISGRSSYCVWNGTSMATPITAGIAALILQADPGIRELGGRNVSDKVCSIMQATSDEIAGCTASKDYYDNTSVNIRLSCGAADAEKAVKLALQTSNKLELKAPEFVFDKNSDGTIKSGEKRYLKIANPNSAVADYAQILYTDDGKDPIKYGKEYKEGISLDFSGKKTFKAVVLCAGQYSSVAAFTGKFASDFTSIDANPAMNIVAGSRAEIIVDYAPEYADPSRLKYSSNNEAIKVDAKGIVTVAKGAAAGTKGVITVTATDQEDIKCEINVTVVEKGMTGLALPSEMTKGVTLYVYSVSVNGVVVSNEYSVRDALIANGINADSVNIISSNKKVVSVQQGKLVAKAAGKAKITVKANDGSKLKQSFKVNVICPVNTFELKSDTGYIATTDKAVAAPLGNSKCKVKLMPVLNAGGSKPSNKKVAYSAEGAVVVSSAGVVKPAKGCRIGDTGVVTAKTTDGTNLVRQYEFTIVSPVKDLKLGFIYTDTDDEGNEKEITEYVKNWKISNPVATLSLGRGHWHDGSGIIKAKMEAEGDADLYVNNPKFVNDFYYVSIDKQDVLTRSYNEVANSYWQYIFEGLKAGKATITYTTRDGSNKKVKIKVVLH